MVCVNLFKINTFAGFPRTRICINLHFTVNAVNAMCSALVACESDKDIKTHAPSAFSMLSIHCNANRPNMGLVTWNSPMNLLVIFAYW